jgi:catechol 2,3-dioxygenase-like lactoylglutathione lyase family enzyme
MSSDNQSFGADRAASVKDIDMKMEVAVIPVTDVDRATEFYKRLGWRLDRTPPGSGIVQLTPHGSGCSIQFGANLTDAAPGSAEEYLVVTDLEETRNALLAAGVDVSDYSHLGPEGFEAGMDPERRSYFSRASFKDPDGNNWLVQEITTRLPGRVEAIDTEYSSANDLAAAMKRASIAHGEHEKRIGEEDANWPAWYAKYMVAEQKGAELPE